jgi:ribose transport system substrate-binding protein
MRERAKKLRRPWSRPVLIGVVALVAVTAAAGTAIGAGVKPTGAGKVTVGKKCGQSVPVGPANKNGVYKTMSQQLKDIYASYPDKLITSPWATTKIKAKPPWKIGYVAFAITNQYNANVLKSMKQEFAIAKKQGLVKGSLITNIPATMQQSTPESQIAAIQQMVRQGVNAIIVLPVDSVSETPAMEAAGKAGVPVILADTPPAPGAKYQVSTWTQNQVEADAGTLGIIKKGNILLIKGIAGNQNDVVLYKQKIADLKNCPDIKVAATLYGNWDNGTTKNVVSQYLASHPGQIDGVLQDGGMFAGVVQAFEARGTKVPPVGVEQCYGGDLSWWLSKLPDYKTVAGCINGYQGGYVYFNVALRILANKGPKYNVLSMPAVTIDNTNLKAYAKAGLPLTSDAELPGPKTAWCDNTCLDKYFVHPGAATK